MVRETRLTPESLVYPLFVCPGKGIRKEVRSMPGVFNLSVDECLKEAQQAKSLGIPAIILFGLLRGLLSLPLTLSLSLALLLGLLGFALVQHSRRKPALPEARSPRPKLGPALTPTGLRPLSQICPTCREEYPSEATFCPNDGNRLVPSRGNAEPTGPSGGVCPICGQGYDPGILTCPKHGEELLPAAVHPTVRAGESLITKKICPVCGKQFSGDSQFCGSCGAALVPVN